AAGDAPARFPLEALLHSSGELSEYYVVMPEEYPPEDEFDPLDYFTSNGLPLLFRRASRSIDPAELPFSLEAAAGYFRERGAAVNPGFRPFAGPYGLCKKDAAELLLFFRDFFAEHRVTPAGYRYLAMLWCHAYASGAG
ncbi:MAG: hypothetical protein FWG74_07470, partial [Planctomycetes bacterium]|nr:hypothetical protein [Planctomycetota bacterium]